jgi:hypothetical protein
MEDCPNKRCNGSLYYDTCHDCGFQDRDGYRQR